MPFVRHQFSIHAGGGISSLWSSSLNEGSYKSGIGYDFGRESSSQPPSTTTDTTRRHPAQVRIEGHTCDVGTEKRNVELGKERAEIVAEYLLEKGIPATVITEVVGKSSTEPLFPNTNEENRRKNRRAVIIVVNDN